MPLSRPDWVIAGAIAALILGVTVVAIVTDPWEPEVPAVTAEIIATHPDDTLVFAIDVPLVYDASSVRSFTVTPEAVVRGDAARVIDARALREEGRLADLLLEITFDYTPPSQEWGATGDTYPEVYNERGFPTGATGRVTEQGHVVVSFRYDSATEGLLTVVLGPEDGER